MFQFYSTHRKCLSCGNSLLTSTRLTRVTLSGPLQRMGVTCYCVHCNRRWRAVSRLPYTWVAWLGPFGRRIWWKSAALELTLKPEEF